MLELLYTSPRKTFATWNNGSYLTLSVFNKAFDAMVIKGGVTGVLGVFKVFKDGHVRQCMDDDYFISGYSMIPVAGGGICLHILDPADYKYKLFDLDPFTLTPVPEPFLTSTISMQKDFVDKERRLFLDVAGSTIAAYSFDAPAVALWSVNLGQSQWNSISWVSDGKVMISHTAQTYGGTTVLFFDYISKATYLNTSLDAYRLAVFDSHCGVVFAIDGSGYTKIYYPQPVPSQLTDPVLDPAIVSLYGGNLVTTQVLGSASEPCQDRIVHWYLQEGLGGLAKETTKSNSNGVASNYYFAPDDPAKVGLEETIRVEALI